VNLTATDFPVLAFSKTGVEKVESEERLTTGTLLGFTKGYLHGYDLVDSSGRKLHIRSAREAKDRGWKKAFDFMMNPIIRVELELEVREKMVDLEPLKQQVIKSLRKDYQAYGDDYVAELIRNVTAAKSTRELIEAVPGLPKSKAT
jgi:uncharacterized protein YeeX (DUF496 family)